MLHDGKKFDVSEADVDQVLDELRSEFAIRKRSVAFFGDAAPRAEMHLIYSGRFAQWIAAVALDHPGGVIK